MTPFTGAHTDQRKGGSPRIAPSWPLLRAKTQKGQGTMGSVPNSVITNSQLGFLLMLRVFKQKTASLVIYYCE